MARYRIQFKKSVAKDLRSIPNKDIKQILARIDSLADDPRPRGVKKLSGNEYYRIRQGSYRIIYALVDDVLLVYVINVAHRSGAYR